MSSADAPQIMDGVAFWTARIPQPHARDLDDGAGTGRARQRCPVGQPPGNWPPPVKSSGCSRWCHSQYRNRTKNAQKTGKTHEKRHKTDPEFLAV